ncbi:MULTISPECIES: helix-turn-helix transcriptional regulator [Amniculibacterium]|uniref:helix-turn-helix transcriptional regulator n=1 Tax=Amniculibacterium TaxID=2715289 RepID=UPI000F592BEB|nr:MULTISPECIES: WYL domain-containing protein [Amniculibacterium]
MEKTLKLLMLLNGTRNYSVPEIAIKFSIDERTVYRHFNKIKNAGFALEKKQGRYRLIPNHPETKTLKKLFHFSEEEIFLIHQILEAQKSSSSVKEKLLKKLNFLYDFNVISKLENTQQLKIIQDLNEAIQKKTKVNLLGYRSSNSSNIEDRIVEPFEFMGDYEGIWCYEIKSQQVKQFKISRIEKVEILNENWQHQSEHKIPFTDAFKMSAKKPVAIVELQLSLKAYNLLREEFPLAVKDISERENLYHLKTSIANFHGIGRFVMGLSDEIKIISPETFKTFIKEKFKSLNF